MSPRWIITPAFSPSSVMEQALPPKGDRVKGDCRCRDFLDGTSNTILVVESPGELVPWTKPDDLEVTLTGDDIDLGGSGRQRIQSTLLRWLGAD